jgi:sulfide:quinone oxidoreductase
LDIGRSGIFDIAKTERNLADYIPKNTTWIKEAVTEFKPADNTLVTNTGTQYTYYALIVCPGIQLDWQKAKGLKENIGKNSVSSNYDFHSAQYTWEMIKNFKGDRAVFTNPTTPIKCGGAPHKIMCLAVDYWLKQGILDKCNVHYLSGLGVIFGAPE